MRRAATLALATTDLRDQMGRLAVFLLVLSSSLATAQPVLSVLTQTQRLDAGLVQEFEASRKVSVRVEFVSSGADYEARIRSLPHNWDLVLADEQRLINLSFLKLLKPLPETVVVPADAQGLEKRARANQDGRAYLNLMADPLGVMFLRKTLTAPGPVSRDWLVEPSTNPLWRSRLALFADERMNIRTAAAATGLAFPIEQTESARPVREWIVRAQLQGRSTSLVAAIPAFLAEKVAVGLAWQSDFIHAGHYVRNLAFTVPAPGSYAERIGIGLVADCRNEQLALDFIRFIYEKKDLLAQRRGLTPLGGQAFPAIPVTGWKVFSDDVPRLRELSTALSQLKKEKDSRRAGAQR